MEDAPDYFQEWAVEPQMVGKKSEMLLVWQSCSSLPQKTVIFGMAEEAFWGPITCAALRLCTLTKQGGEVKGGR